MITHVIFDFDGVMAEPGFRLALAELMSPAAADLTIEGQQQANSPYEDLEALTAIARQGMRALLKSGYVVGQGSEADFWATLTATSDIGGSSALFRSAVIRRSVVRLSMVALVDQLRASGITVALLSDHTDWLDEIAATSDLVDHFDFFYNSYYIQQSKRDALVFDRVVGLMESTADKTLFVDDNPANVDRAVSRGLQGIVYQQFPQVVEEMQGLCSGLNAALCQDSVVKDR